jgi:hypothetical protein
MASLRITEIPGIPGIPGALLMSVHSRATPSAADTCRTLQHFDESNFSSDKVALELISGSGKPQCSQWQHHFMSS